MSYPTRTVQGASDAARATIRIHAISVYGQSGSLARSLQYPVRPLTHDSGGLHTVSARLVALLSSADMQTIQEWATSEECFIRLEWTFPGQSSPSFTTRHLLVLAQAPGDVGFSGGLGPVERMSKIDEILGLSKAPVPASLNVPRYSLFANSASQPPLYGVPREPSFTFPTADDTLSVCSELTSATTISDPDMDYSFTIPPASGVNHAAQIDYPRHPGWEEDEFPPEELLCREAFLKHSDMSVLSANLAGCGLGASSFGACYPNHFDLELQDTGILPEQLFCMHAFQEQKREAHALYSRNGDTSGFLAVIASTSRLLSNRSQDRMSQLPPEFG
ncbi:hypothetical protein VTI74DRAFT_2302 [Chaetomium olivicolor]